MSSSAVTEQTGSTVLKCPECGSSSFFRNGFTKNEFGNIQRYKCRDCGGRFSDPSDILRARAVSVSYLQDIPTHNLSSLNVVLDNKGDIQICAEDTVKNLGNETQQVTSVSQIQKTDGTNIDLVIADYKQYIQKEHIVNDLTLSKYVSRLKRLSHEYNQPI
jgi:predicted RNA-binding Zn-ribbon protein involved in translation (DUF1610 family)